MQIRRSGNRTDRRPLAEGCECACCARYDRAYLRHLFTSEESLGPRLIALHNVHFLVALMREARTALGELRFDSWSAEWLARYHAGRAPEGAGV